MKERFCEIILAVNIIISLFIAELLISKLDVLPRNIVSQVGLIIVVTWLFIKLENKFNFFEE